MLTTASPLRIGSAPALGGVNRSHPINAKGGSWWFESPHLAGSRSLRDRLGDRHGTLTGGASWSLGPGGIWSINYDGVDDFTDVGLISYVKFTVAFWFKPNSPTAFRPIAACRAAGSSTWQVTNHSDNRPYFSCYNGSETEFATYNTAAVPSSNGRWEHFAGTFDGSNVASYQDGRLVGTATLTGTLAAASVHTMFGANAGGFAWAGSIRDARIAPAALTATEVASLYDLSRRGYPGVLNRVGTAAWMASVAASTTCTLAAQGQPATVAFAATVTPPARTGTLAEVAAAAVVALVATNTPPAITGTMAEAGQAGTVAFAATNTPPAITSTLAEIAAAGTVALIATNTPPAITSTLAEAGQPATVAFASTNTPPAITSTLASSADAATATLAGTTGVATTGVAIRRRSGGAIALGDAINRSHRLNFGLAARWLALPGRMSGPTYYDLAGTSHGTLAGGPAWQGTSRPGGMGHLLFDGTNSVHLSDSLLVGATAVTISFWIRPDNTGASAGHRIVGKWGPTVAEQAILVGHDDSSGSALVFAISNASGTGYTIRTAAGAFTDGAWTHVTCVWYGTGSASIYLDGVPASFSTNNISSQASSIPASTSPLYLGKNQSAENGTIGAVDDLAIFTRALSDLEISELHRLSRIGYPGVLNRVGTAALVAGAVASDAITGTLGEVAAAGTVAFAGTNTPPAITGDLAEVAAAATVAFAGTNTPPAITGDLAEVAATGTVAFVGTNTPPAITGDLAEAGVAATVAFTSTNTPPSVTGTLAEVADAATESYTAVSTLGTVATLAAAGQPATVAFDATNTPPAVTGTLAEAAATGSVAFVGVNTPPAITGTLAEAAASGTVAFVGTNTPPAITGTLAEVSITATVALVATGAAPTGITATLAAAGAGAVAALAATYTPPAIVATLNEVAASATVAFAQAGVGITLFASTGALRRVDPVQSTGRVRDIDPGQTTGTQR